MEIITITGETAFAAGQIHCESWRESHRAFCSAAFIASHTAQTQTEYILSEMGKGRRFYMLIDHQPVGIVSVWENRIENLYVLPEQQRKGYGTALLRHAIGKCRGVAALWVLSNNDRALRFYEKHGFLQSGKRIPRKNGLCEMEMTLKAVEKI